MMCLSKVARAELRTPERRARKSQAPGSRQRDLRFQSVRRHELLWQVALCFPTLALSCWESENPR